METTERTLFLNGAIAEESWYDDDVTPNLFRSELMNGTGNITVWINSPGGDCVAAAQIYNMLKDYNGKITVKIDGLAASAASVVAMAGDKVMMSPVAMLMIHNPLTVAFGDSEEMKKAIDMLSEVKESIINAYELKTGLSRAKISHLMDAETWMDANKALELGFVDGILFKDADTDEEDEEIVVEETEESEESEEPSPTPAAEPEQDEDEEKETVKVVKPKQNSMLFSRKTSSASLVNKVSSKLASEPTGTKIADLEKRLNLIKP